MKEVHSIPSELALWLRRHAQVYLSEFLIKKIIHYSKKFYSDVLRTLTWSTEVSARKGFILSSSPIPVFFFTFSRDHTIGNDMWPGSVSHYLRSSSKITIFLDNLNLEGRHIQSGMTQRLLKSPAIVPIPSKTNGLGPITEWHTPEIKPVDTALCDLPVLQIEEVEHGGVRWPCLHGPKYTRATFQTFIPTQSSGPLGRLQTLACEIWINTCLCCWPMYQSGRGVLNRFLIQLSLWYLINAIFQNH